MKIGIAFNTEPAAAEGVLDFIFKQKIPVFAVCLLCALPLNEKVYGDATVFYCRYFPKQDKLGVASGHTGDLGFDEHICKSRRASSAGSFRQQKPYQRLKALAICENLLRRYGCTNVMGVISVPNGTEIPCAPARLLLPCGVTGEAAKVFAAATEDKWLPQLIL